MAITKEQPTARGTNVPEEDIEYSLDEPISERPKLTKREQLLQWKREKAGLGLMQLISFGAGLLGRFKIAPVLPEDVAAVHYHARPIAKSMADCASEDERFAAVFDRLTDLGPYGVIIEAISPLVIQIVANHSSEVRNDPAIAVGMGALPPDTLMKLVVGNVGADQEDISVSVNGDGASQ